MHKPLLALALVAVMSLTACDNNKDQTDVATAPPPPVADNMSAPPPPGTPVVESAAAKPIPIAPEPAAASSGGNAKTYTVQPKDTIFSIARKVYGDDRKAKEIIALNRLADPNKIMVGQVLQLP